MRCFSIIKEVKLMWDDVLDMEIDKLIEACKNIAEGDDDSTNYLCNICMEFIEASSALGSKLNNATEIYRHAVDLATEHIDIPQICSSYLFLLCAHIRSNFIRDMKDYREVELLLSTAILHHFIAVDMNDISKIDHATMYSLHIASAVTDIIRFRTILGKDTSDTTELVREAYRMLRVYAPNRGQKERKSLEEVSGISEKDILDQNSTSDDKKDDLPN
ncbi:MAG: hypothetical protein KBS95_05645 [Alistipes sp.]|nr:hypothetical protein [Candidatus Alistipes equi]